MARRISSQPYKPVILSLMYSTVASVAGSNGLPAQPQPLRVVRVVLFNGFLPAPESESLVYLPVSTSQPVYLERNSTRCSSRVHPCYTTKSGSPACKKTLQKSKRPRNSFLVLLSGRCNAQSSYSEFLMTCLLLLSVLLLDISVLEFHSPSLSRYILGQSSAVPYSKSFDGYC